MEHLLSALLVAIFKNICRRIDTENCEYSIISNKLEPQVNFSTFFFRKRSSQHKVFSVKHAWFV